jgi:uncharacterized delta-60 repeat protein
MRTTALQIERTNTERASPRYKSSVSAYRDHYFTWLSIFFLALLTVMTATALRAQSVNDGYQPVMNSRYVYDAVLQPDGKALVIGEFNTVNGIARKGIVRLNHDGTLDTSFAASTFTGTQSYIQSTTLQADGKVVVVGRFDTFNGLARNNITRLNADGSTDASFNPGSGVDGYIYAVAIQPDGRIVIAGAGFTTINGVSRNGIARLNVDGSLDASFNPGTGLNPAGGIGVVLVQPDGRLVIGGRFFTFNGVATSALFRLNADGTRDNTFPSGSGFGYDPDTMTGAASVSNAILQKDGRIVVQGSFNSVNGVARNGFARLNANGTLDTSFNVAGADNCCVRKLVSLKSGQILVVGSFRSFSGQQDLGIGYNDAVRLNTDGSVDRSFHIARYVLEPNDGGLSSAAEQSDGSIILVGSFTQFYGDPHTGIVRVNAAGEKEISYADPFGRRGTDYEVFAMAHEANGSVLIAGAFTTVDGTNNTARKSIARLDASSLASLPFNAGAGGNGSVYTIATDRLGRVLVGGYFSTFDGSPYGRIVRLNIDGSVDTSFTQIVGAPNAGDSVNAIVVQPDGKIIVGGRFTSFGGVIASGIVRLNEDGSIDTTFNAGTGTNGGVSGVALQPDGQILITGSFSSVNGFLRRALARLNAGGGVDLSFNATGLTGYTAGSLVLRPDGRMVVSIAKTNVVAVRGFNANGGADSSFGTTNFSGDFIEGNVFISSLSLQADGRLIVGGAFTLADGVAANNIVRLEGDGTRDTSFSANTNGIVYSTVLQPDGRLLMGGDFTTINGVARKHVGRLSATSPAFFEFQNLGTNGMQWVQSGTAPALTDVHFDYSTDSVIWIPLESLATSLLPKFVGGAWRVQPWTIPENTNFYIRGRARGAASNNADSRIGGVQNFYVRSLPTYSVTINLTGPAGGSVTGTGLTCTTTTCTGTYTAGTVVNFTAVPGSNQQFAGWSSAPNCGSAIPCAVTINANVTIGAAFAAVVNSSVNVGQNYLVADLNGDGKSDFIVRDAVTGGVDAYLMDGTAILSGRALIGPGGWTATHTADLNGDGKADIIWRNTNGTTAVWLMNGLNPIADAVLTPGAGWNVTHVTGVNRGNKALIFWQHTDGRVAVWQMDGVTPVGGAVVMAAGSGWSITHVADLNNDGKTDILWRHTDGRVAAWLMDGVMPTTGAVLLNLPDWSITHTADLNNDGNADIFWRNIDGTVSVWLMNGTAQLNVAGMTNNAILNPGPGWGLSHTADLNGDGKADILWRHIDGRIAAWTMSGVVPINGAVLSPGAGWSIVRMGKFNLDPYADIIWQHTDGRIAIWLMNNLTPIGGAVVFGAGNLQVVP